MPVLLGKAGSGKTGVAIQMAIHMQRACPEEAHVGLYMADEGLGAAIIRVAQSLGFDRAELEAAKPDVIEEASKALEKLPRVWCMDPDSAGSSLEAFLAGMLERAGDAPKIMVIDSMQVVPCEAASGKDERLTIAKVAETMKKFSRKYRAIPIPLSQVNRLSYRNKKASENSDPLSAGAGSGAIEHMADIQINLDTEDDSDRVSVLISKSRIGKKRLKPFWLELNRERATFQEVDEMEIAKEKAGEMAEKATARMWVHAKKVLAALKKNPGGLTSRRLRELTGMSGAAFNEATAMLQEQGRVYGEENPGRGGGTLWRMGNDGFEGVEND
jgi:KaiC/GvpD/RAD55 family RecA-like ATPase